MKKKNDMRVYNLMFPVWMLVWWPSWLWLALIPLNYGIDALVLRLSLSAGSDRAAFLRKHTWKICLAGFVGDFLGSALLFAVYAFTPGDPLSYNLAYAPFGNAAALAVTLAALLLSAGAIFLLDRRILLRAALDPDGARRAARNLAVFTAPYLFLFPSGLLYR